MESYGMTHIGQKRSINQDYIYFSDQSVGKLSNLYIVADGMGGHKAGDKASSFAVERFVELVSQMGKDEPVCVMKDAMEQVNRELYELASSQAEYDGMGTTFVAATVWDHEVYIMNIGDSRMYFWDGELKQISKDHSLVEELVRNGELTREEAKNHPRKNVITRAIGVDEEVKIDFFQLEIQQGNRILLCSDGLSNMLSDEEIDRILGQKTEIGQIVEKLIEGANEAGGVDNIAVVVAESKVR